MTLQEFEAELAANNFPPAVPVHKDAGYALDAHQHDFAACALIIDGEITLVVDGISTCYRRGDVFRLQAFEENLERAGPQGVHYLAGRKFMQPADQTDLTVAQV